MVDLSLLAFCDFYILSHPLSQNKKKENYHCICGSLPLVSNEFISSMKMLVYQITFKNFVSGCKCITVKKIERDEKKFLYT